LGGQLIVGGWVSLTVTLNEQFAVLFDASLPTQETTVAPTLKVEPEGGVHVTVAPPQLSVALAE
jgi:hypothetical protein